MPSIQEGVSRTYDTPSYLFKFENFKSETRKALHPANITTNSCHALQAVPRGPRDGELVNTRRTTVAHEEGNKCPN